MNKLGGAAVIAAAVLVAVGCAPDETTPEPSPTPTITADTVVDEISVGIASGTATVEVHPLVRQGDRLVLTLDLTADDVPRHDPLYELEVAWSSRSYLNLTRWIGVRLLDLDGDRVLTPGVDAEGDTVSIEQEVDDHTDPQRLQLVYADAGTESLTLLLPQGGLVADVPVIDGDAPTVADEDPIEASDAVDAGVFPLVSYAVDLASTTRTEKDADQARIALGADVLFAYDSAELNSTARDVIAGAAAEILSREPGTVQVVGHTDSDGSDAYNQDLSERRAAAVAAELRTLLDEADYPFEVSGRGESEPVASNDDKKGRAQNRRVEVVIDTPLAVDPTQVVSPEPPEIEGPVATGAEGLVIENTRPWHVSIPRAYVLDGHLIVEVRTEVQDDETDSAFGPAIYEGSFPKPPGLEKLRSMAGMAVMNGSLATVPMLHQPLESEPEALVPLTDLATFAQLDGGNSRTSVLVYPELAVGDTITVDLLGVYVPGWRLTDIPVEER